MSLLLLKVSVLLMTALLAARLLRSAPAIARHRLWSFAFAAMLMLPALAASLPALHVPVPAGWEPAAPARATSPPAPAAVDSPAPSPSAPVAMSTTVNAAPEPIGNDLRSSRAPQWPSLSTVLLSIWLIGLAGAITTVFSSLWQVQKLMRTAAVVRDDEWQRAAEALGRQLGVRHPVQLLSSPNVGTPMAGGIRRPAIFLPQSAVSWNPERRDLVLAHELAHLAGHDPLRHLMTRLSLACYWFHPLAWLAAREAVIAREQACDETVLAMGARPSAYARLLLDLAQLAPARPQARLLGALPMVQRSHLERRLMAILNRDFRPTTSRFIAGQAIGVALLTLSVAAATPAVEDALDQPQGTPVSGVQSGVVGGIPTGAAVGVQGGGVPGVSGGAIAGVRGGGVPGVQGGAVVGAPGQAVAGVPGGVALGVPGGAIGGVPGGPVGAVPGGVFGGVHGAPFAAAAETVILDDQSSRDLECWSEDGYRGNFRGSSTSQNVGGRTVVTEQVGFRNGDRIIQRTFGGLRLCMIAENLGDRFDTDRPSQWIGRSRRVVMEARRGSTVQRLEFNGRTPTWQVGNSIRDFDAAAETWRDRMLAVLDTTWELSTLHGEESGLRGQISSIQGQRSSLQGQISSLQGQVSSMQGRISSAQGELSSLLGQISSIQGHESSLQGRISSEQGAISSLSATRYDANGNERARIATRIADHRAEIARIEQQIRDYDADRRIAAVQRQIDGLNTRGRIRAIEDEIRNFDLDSKVRAIERRIEDLDVRGRVAEIERQIQRLDVPRRSRELEDRLDADLPRLTAAISAVR